MKYLLSFQGIKVCLSKLGNEVFWILVGQLLAFAGGFIGIKVLTNLLGPAGYGQLALGLTIAGLFTMYVYGPLANAVARFYVVYREKGELGAYFSVLKKSHAVLAVFLILSALLAGMITYFISGYEWAMIVLLSSLFGVVSGINASYISLQSSIRQRKVVALHQAADAWLRIGLSIVLLLFFDTSGSTALAGYLLGTLLITFSQGLFALRNSEIKAHWKKQDNDEIAEKRCFRELSGYAASFMIFSSFAAISMYADRWVLQGILGAWAVGVYAAIFQIAASPVNMFFSMLNQLIIPIVFEHAGAMTTADQADSSASVVRQTVLLSSVAMSLVMVIAWIFSEQLVALFTSKAFTAFHNLLPVTVFGIAVFNIAQIFTLKGACFNRPKIYFWPKAIQAFTFLAAAFGMAKRFGIMGVALALCLSSVIYLMAIFVVNSRITFTHNH